MPPVDNLLNYLKTRRSALSLTLDEPGPTREQLRSILEIATRVPDHGKLAPWRIVLWTPETRKNMCAALLEQLENNQQGPALEKMRKGTEKLLHAPCVLAVISCVNDDAKVPGWEQQLSAGAVCMNALIAANAVGFEAQWLTGWYVYDDDAKDILGLEDGERLAGILHIGSSDTVKNERDRPDIEQVFSIR